MDEKLERTGWRNASELLRAGVEAGIISEKEAWAMQRDAAKDALKGMGEQQRGVVTKAKLRLAGTLPHAGRRHRLADEIFIAVAQYLAKKDRRTMP